MREVASYPAVGATAALTGLLFVAVLIDLDRIRSLPRLPAPAVETLSLILLVVVVSRLGLAPQSAGSFGVEITACSAAIALVVLGVQLRHGPDNASDPVWWFLSRLANIQVPVLL